MSNSEHQGKHFVIQKGKAICNKGTSFPNFKATSQQKHFWNAKSCESDCLAITEDDLTFNPSSVPFGSCSLKNGKPCGYAPAGKWTKVYNDVQIMGKGCVTEISELRCVIGGKITVLKHGQTTELTKQNLKNADTEILVQICPLADFADFLDEIEEDNTYDYQ